MRISQLVPAEPGWKAVFAEPDGSESQSRIVGWAVVGAVAGEEADEDADAGGDELVGVIVDPLDPARIVPATGAASPGGGGFKRYRFEAPKPPKAPEPPAPSPAEMAQQLAKSRFRRRG